MFESEPNVLATVFPARWDNYVFIKHRIMTSQTVADTSGSASYHSISRTSVTVPAIAAAATIAGDISSVRPVGLP